MATKTVRYCTVCGEPHFHTAGSLYCSPACRQKALRERRKQTLKEIKIANEALVAQVAEKDNIIQKQLEIVKKDLSIAKERQIAISDFLQKKDTQLAIFEKAESDLRGKIDNINKLKNIHNLKESILLHDKLIELIKKHQLWVSENLQQMIKIFGQRRSATRWQ